MEREEKKIEMLRENSWHFRHLEKLHGQLDQSLQELTRRRVLTPQEEIQKKEFQKRKLAAKDEMTQMIRDFKGSPIAEDLKPDRSSPPMSAGGR